MILWIIGNYAAKRLGGAALEEFPFPELGLLATIAAVIIALLILTTQRHGDELAEKRAQLTLQIALLSEKKVAKIIELLEEQRRDNPLLASRTTASRTRWRCRSIPRWRWRGSSRHMPSPNDSHYRCA